MKTPLYQQVRAAPQTRDAQAAREKIADLDGALDAVLSAPHFAALMEGLAEHSPYLWRLISANPQRLLRLAQEEPETAVARILATARAQTRRAGDAQDVMIALRYAKQEAALVIALADIGGLWDVMAVTRALTQFADGMVSCALSFLLREAAASGKLNLVDPENPEHGCGVVVLAN